MSDDFRLTRDDLLDSGGWTTSQTERLARDNPIGLLWLVVKGIAPVSYAEAKAALLAIPAPVRDPNIRGLRAEIEKSPEAVQRRFVLQAIERLAR